MGLYTRVHKAYFAKKSGKATANCRLFIFIHFTVICFHKGFKSGFVFKGIIYDLRIVQ